MSRVPGQPSGVEVVAQQRPQSESGWSRGAIAGQGIAFPEHWKHPLRITRYQPFGGPVYPTTPQLVVNPPEATASGQAFVPNVQMVVRCPKATASAVAFAASIGASAPGMTPPWRPFYEGRHGIGFDQD